jgi:hypothetical protein
MSIEGTTSELREREKDILARAEAMGGQIVQLKLEIGRLNNERNTLMQSRNSILREIERRTETPEEPAISDHALLRYIERVIGIDLDELRRQIMTPTLESAIRMGAKSLVDNGVTYRIQNGKVITLMDRSSKKAKPPRFQENEEDVEHA